MNYPIELQKSFRCPVCYSQFRIEKESFICVNHSCEINFPVINGIPVLINEDNSVFTIQDFVDQKNTTFKNESLLFNIFRKIIPSISKNIKAKTNYNKLLSLLEKQSPQAKVLILGGSILGEGIEDFLRASNFVFLETDVTFGPRTQVIVDAHNIPLEDSSFDCIIIQAVLEHVVDPYRCTKEVHRVLKRDGFIYAETPFMQQVHMGRYDFHRFTHLGHRRLFREFTEIDSGAVCGPGMALAWAYSNFIFSFFNSKKLRKLLILFTNLTSFFWKYFDYFLIDKPGTLDAASGYYFIGKKSVHPISDKEILKQYRGLL
jgi:SAM-dependent methyltransferase/uncharacterized protein YbaR (Trm112 family)